MASRNLPEMPAGPVLELYGQRKRFTVPVGLKCLLEELSREVLRDQPTNIYQFLADYLDAKLEKECGKRTRRKSWQEHRWSWEGPSLLDDNELAEFLEEHNLTFSTANRVATIIQAAYRGFRDRKLAKEIRNNLDKDDLYLEYDGEDAYVTKDCYGNFIRFTGDDVERILANYRMTLDEANKFAVKIQRTFRGTRTRESFSKRYPALAERLLAIEKRLKKKLPIPGPEMEFEGESQGSASKIQVQRNDSLNRPTNFEFAGEGYEDEEPEEIGDEEMGGEDYSTSKSSFKEKGPSFGLHSFGIQPSETEEDLEGSERGGKDEFDDENETPKMSAQESVAVVEE